MSGRRATYVDSSAVCTYDDRLAAAAAALGLSVVAPS